MQVANEGSSKYLHMEVPTKASNSSSKTGVVYIYI